ncbi:ATP synthase F(0) complex subunit k, mitochondrial-like [Lycorma delicatula]|uniref:ATP synthase F(0) complex subunit k, mitochondrial-like n=1 Tax=Lycorma delicatula TaxID=130591 RepID=UPI003F50E7EE
MAGPSEGEEANFKGLSKYFNSMTSTGRANFSKATYLTVAALFVITKVYKKLFKPTATETTKKK